MLRIMVKMLLAFALISCGGEKKRPVYVDVESFEEEEPHEQGEELGVQDEYGLQTQSGDEVAVPFRYNGGVKYLPVRVNGYSFEMIFDTGCSDALISLAEANYLYQKGVLTTDDVLGIGNSTIADGSIVENMIVNLREVVVGDKIVCHDVKASVSNNTKAPLLLGNGVMDRLAAVTVDNENEVIIFKMK